MDKTLLILNSILVLACACLLYLGHLALLRPEEHLDLALFMFVTGFVGLGLSLYLLIRDATITR